jgi:hypothetical protein
MTDLIMFVPTRGRVDNVARFWNACGDLNRANTLVMFGVDEDDPELPAYRELGVQVEVVEPRGPGMVGALNQLAERYAGQATCLGFAGDDHCPRTVGWDQRLCDAIEAMGGGVAYGNDLIQGPNLATAVVMDACIPATLGYMAPPTLQHLYVDNVWLDWGRGLGRLAYRHDVVIEHLHPLVGKAENDERYELVNNGGMFGRDEAAYREYLAGGLEADLEKLRAVIS